MTSISSATNSNSFTNKLPATQANPTITQQAISQLLQFLGKNHYQGWEPYDIRLRNWPAWLTSRPLRVLVTQLMRISPRPILRSVQRPQFYANAVALFAQAFLILYRITGQSEFRQRAIFFLDWLQQHRSPVTNNFSIGASYQVNLKDYGAQPDSPAPFITAMAVEAFLAGFEILREQRYLEFAESGIRFFLDELPQIQVTPNQRYFVYHPNNHRFYPNLPAVVAGTLAHFCSISPDSIVLETAISNLRYVVNWQRPDGSWFYRPNVRYCDNFHTGFILEALAKFEHYLQDQTFRDHLLKGLNYYQHQLFHASGRPRHKRLYGLPTNADSLLTRLDLRDCAQGIILYSLLARWDRKFFDAASNLAEWTINNFRAPEGFFYYQQLPCYIIKGPFISMQAWMLLALSKVAFASQSYC
ncbi:MAG: hypothetical protein ONB13_04095 [candidate division KSB1 bacterium]|nr:hypothetical protein [candidate division KSB1 bacterium]